MMTTIEALHIGVDWGVYFSYSLTYTAYIITIRGATMNMGIS